MGATLILAKNTAEGYEYARKIGLERGSYRLVRNAHAIRGVRHAEVHILPSFLARWDRHNILGALRWARTLEVFYVDPEDVFAPSPEDFEPMRPADAARIDAHLAVDKALDELENEGGLVLDPEVAAEVDQIDLDVSQGSVVLRIMGQGIEQMQVDLESERTALDDLRSDPFDGAVVADDFDAFFKETDEQTAAPEQVEDPASAAESRKGRRRSRCKTCGTLHFKGDPCPEDAVDSTDVPEEPVRTANEVTQPSGDIFDFVRR